jgi:hypothetical protein
LQPIPDRTIVTANSLGGSWLSISTPARIVIILWDRLFLNVFVDSVVDDTNKQTNEQFEAPLQIRNPALRRMHRRKQARFFSFFFVNLRETAPTHGAHENLNPAKHQNF